MVEQTDLLLQLVGIVLEVQLLDDVLLFYSFDVEEVILVIGEHFGGIVEVDSDHVIAEGVADAILGGVVYPFFNSDIDILDFGDSFSGSFLIVTFVAVFEDALLALGPADVFLVGFVDRIGPVGGEKFLLALLAHVSAGGLNILNYTN